MESSFPFIRPGPGARVLVLHVEVEVKWHLHPVGWQVEEEEEDLGSSVKSATAGEPDEKTSPSLLFNRCFLLTLNTSIHLSSVWIITLLLLAELMLLCCCGIPQLPQMWRRGQPAVCYVSPFRRWTKATGELGQMLSGSRAFTWRRSSLTVWRGSHQFPFFPFTKGK